MKMVLEVKDLCKQYTRGGRPFYAVDHVSLTMDRGEFVSIIGRSGSGKSTLLNLIAGLLDPTAGEIRICGKSLAGMDDEALSALRNTTLGYVPQGQTVLGNLTVLDNVRLPFISAPAPALRRPAPGPFWSRWALAIWQVRCPGSFRAVNCGASPSPGP